MKTAREFGHAYAAWGHGEGIEGFSGPVDLDMYPEIPDSDCREMQEAGIALDIREYWRGFNEFFEGR